MINKILKLANRFYSFAAPLDELIQSELMRGVPDVQAYKEHYSASGNLYRIIYVDQSFVGTLKWAEIFRYIQPVEEAKNKIKQKISSSEGKVSSKMIEELKWLSDKFNPDAINIIAYRFGPDDLIGPEALDHDIAHKLFDSARHGTQSASFNKFILAWMKDYSFYHDGEDVTDKVAELHSFSNLSEGISNFMCYMLLNNSDTARVSDVNLKLGRIDDVISDIAIEYVKNGESLSNLKFSPEKAFAVALVDEEESGEHKYFIDFNKPFYNQYLDRSINKNDMRKNQVILEIRPKDDSLPHLNAVLNNVIEYFENKLSRFFNFLNGKVMMLWNSGDTDIDNM